MKRPQAKTVFERFLHSQTSGSIILLLATLSAIAWANSPWSQLYHTLSHLEIGTHFAGQDYSLTLDHWVKDGLMSIFFFVVGLEIKREIVVGELSTLRRATLPVVAAIGGALFPALIYYSFNSSGPAVSGWGVPMATDIAFALGILALFGNRVPIGLKVFLTALAIVDDLIAVAVIALFYTEKINFLALVTAAALLFLLSYIIRRRFRRPGIHLALIIAIWLCVFLSGVHATIAGVLIAMVYPVKAQVRPNLFLDTVATHLEKLKGSQLTRRSMIKDKEQLKAITRIYLAAEDMIPAGIYLEQNLHNVQAFLILPLFALFAAGVTVEPSMLQRFPSSVGLGIMLGLIVGKQIGIFGFSFLVIKLRIVKLSPQINWGQIWGTSLLGGMGFTMSIFISELAFNDPVLLADAKISIFIGSIIAAVLGYVVLNKSLPTLETPQQLPGRDKSD